MFKNLLSFIIVSVISVSLSAQKANYYKRVFVDAEYYLLYEEYKDALPLYLEIYNTYTENSNICYRIGICYLNIRNEKHKSIPFFEKAIRNVSDTYKEGYFTETQAPREVFLHYGRALRVKGDFEKARQAFETYKSMLPEKDNTNIEVVQQEIKSLEFAEQMKLNPIAAKFMSVGRTINTRFPEVNATVCTNYKVMVYTSIQQFYNAILVSKFENNEWTFPVNINTQTLADGPIKNVGISGDGNTIVLARNDNDIFNLYTSTYDTTKKTWSPIVKLPKEVNTRYWETHGSFSKNCDTLYFSSNKPGGKGGFDIYMSTKVATGWSQPQTLGEAINTSFDESSPVVSPDGKRLYFSSNGHPTMGGFDIFVSYKREGKWTSPVNLGYPLNSPDDDNFFFPIGDGSRGLISKTFAESSGEDDIYLVEFITQPHENTSNDLSASPITLEKSNTQSFNPSNGHLSVP